MAHDLVLGCTNTSWARGSFVGQEEGLSPPLTDKEKARIEKLALVEMRATQGDPQAQALIVKLNVALNDLARKARRGDAKAARTLSTLQESGLIQRIASTSSKNPKLAMAGTVGFNSHWRYCCPDAAGAAPMVDGLPHPNPLTAEQKEDLRVYIRHLPPSAASQKADQERMIAQLRKQFGEAKQKALAGDPSGLARWKELVEWTNRVQDEGLRNSPGALMQLQTISKTGLFNPRFRVAGSR